MRSLYSKFNFGYSKLESIDVGLDKFLHLWYIIITDSSRWNLSRGPSEKCSKRIGDKYIICLQAAQKIRSPVIHMTPYKHYFSIVPGLQPV